MRNWVKLIGILTLACPLLASVATAQQTAYSVGVARVDVTPDYPIRLNGFGNRREEADGVSQQIYARALAISQGDEQPVVVIAVDSLGVRLPLVDEVAERLRRRFGVPRERIALTFTHSHCTPKVNGASDNIFSQAIPAAHQAHIDRYTKELTDHIERAARQAIKQRRPAKLEYGVGTVKFAANRRTPGGPVDHDLPMLVVRDDASGAVRAVYVSYACHCVTLSFNQISGDWAGYAASAIERVAPGATALVSIGLGSDSNPSSGVTGDKVDVAEAQGAEIATEVARLLKTKLKPITASPRAQLRRIALPLNEPPSRGQLEQLSTKGGAAGYNAQTQLARLDRGEKLLTKIDYPVQTFSFGEQLSIVFLAGEVCVDYSTRLKRELDRDRLWLNGYSNDFCSYIPSERLVKEGGYGGGAETPYFALPTTLKPGLEKQIVTEVKRQVPESLRVPEGTGGVAPKSPADSLACLQTARELRVELVVAEPIVVDPVAIDFGPDGRLWVAEMNDYGRGVYEQFEPTGRVRSLRDEDGDGRFESAKTFLDGLRFPTDVKVLPNGVLICDAPHILFARDTDRDGQADDVERIFTGFEVRNAQARVNSLRLGLDNWLYGSCGLFGGRVTNFSTDEKVDLSNRDFRFELGGRIEPVTGRTQQGRCRNDWGDWFGCTNGTLITHYPIEDRYHRRNQLVAPPPSGVGVATGPDAARLIPAGEIVRFELSGAPGRPTSACGLEIYRDNLLGEDFYGNAFTCEPVHQLVHRLVLEPRGVSFAGRRPRGESDREFLASTDRWFRPVQVRTGPDGAIWVVDMYRYVIEHSRWIPQKTLAELDIYAGRGRGRIYRIAPAEKELRPWPRLDRMATNELARQLDHPNGAIRDLAQQQLVFRGGAAADDVRDALNESRSALGVLHALCPLAGLDSLRAADLLPGFSRDHAELLRHAVRLSEGRLDDEELLTEVVGLAAHPHVRVRRQVAYTLGESTDKRATAALARIIATSRDNYLRTAALSSISESNVAAVLASYSQLPKGRRRVTDLTELARQAVQLGKPSDVQSALRVALEAGRDDQRRMYEVVAKLLDAADQRRDRVAFDTQLVDLLHRRIASASECLLDDQQTLSERRGALALISRRGGPATRQLQLSSASRRLGDVAQLLSPRQPVELQQDAVGAVLRMEGDGAAALLDNWPRLGPQVRRTIVEAMVARDGLAERLLQAIRGDTIAANGLTAIHRQQLLQHRQASIRQLAAKTFDVTPDESRRSVIEKYRAALPAGQSVERGKELFRKSCSNCHRLEDHGHTVGPDLAALTNRDPLYLLKEILDPNRAVDARYVSWLAIDQQGRSVNGLLVEETSTAIRLRAAEGKEHVILRGDIDELKASGKSIMPDGLEKDITPPEMAQIIAYVAGLGPPPKSFPGNEPRVVSANPQGEFRLAAAAAEIRGATILFERPFGNIGYWHGERDHATWRVDAGGSADVEYDLYIDYSCADDSAGNRYRIDGFGQPILGEVPATGGWDRYVQRKLGRVKLAAGRNAVVVSPHGPLVRRALFDLRELRLVPSGATTEFDSAAPATVVPDQPLPRGTAAVAQFLLDSTQSIERRQTVIDRRPGMGPAIVAQLASAIGRDHEEEYRRIPWIWRVAIAVGKRNDGGELRDLLDASLPQGREPLRDWQAVVIGGGVINGISQLGLWPDERLAEVVRGVPNGAARWRRTMQLAAAMADDKRVKSGTRYDALRMIALAGWDNSGEQLKRYLAVGIPDELQMGAVSGLVDVQDPRVAAILLDRWSSLSKRNRQLAFAGLLRTEQRALALLAAAAAGTVDRKTLDRTKLIEHRSAKVQAAANSLFGDDE